MKRYIGIDKNGNWHTFSNASEPTREEFGNIYVAVIGEFKTKRAQTWALKYGKNNPHFQHVDDAERLSKVRQ